MVQRPLVVRSPREREPRRICIADTFSTRQIRTGLSRLHGMSRPLEMGWILKAESEKRTVELLSISGRDQARAMLAAEARAGLRALPSLPSTSLRFRLRGRKASGREWIEIEVCRIAQLIALSDTMPPYGHRCTGLECRELRCALMTMLPI